MPSPGLRNCALSRRGTVPPRKASPETLVRLAADHAESLRRAGVLELTVEGLTLKLAPWEPPAPAPTSTTKTEVEEREIYSDPLKDPTTYINGVVPGFEREESDA